MRHSALIVFAALAVAALHQIAFMKVELAVTSSVGGVDGSADGVGGGAVEKIRYGRERDRQ
jgi:hypothetical protein